MKKFTTIEEQLKFHEGNKLFPYKCSEGKLTIGIGRNLSENGISFEESLFLFQNDLDTCKIDLIKLFGEEVWDNFGEARRRALIDLRFNLGAGKFRGFNRMIRACKNDQWDLAAYELTDSKWWSQVQEDRKMLLYNQLKTGEC